MAKSSESGGGRRWEVMALRMRSASSSAALVVDRPSIARSTVIGSADDQGRLSSASRMRGVGGEGIATAKGLPIDVLEELRYRGWRPGPGRRGPQVRWVAIDAGQVVV